MSNQVRVKIRQIDKVGEVLDHLVTAGVTDIGNVEFLVSEPSKALDQAREAAIADAQRKAEVYAHASGIQLGRVEWISEDSGFAPPVPTRAQGASAAMAAPVPIASGEDTLRVRVTVGFDIARCDRASFDPGLTGMGAMNILAAEFSAVYGRVQRAVRRACRAGELTG